MALQVVHHARALYATYICLLLLAILIAPGQWAVACGDPCELNQTAWCDCPGGACREDFEQQGYYYDDVNCGGGYYCRWGVCFVYTTNPPHEGDCEFLCCSDDQSACSLSTH
jgi:hypothetical protein